MQNKKILSIGLVCLDVVVSCQSFPEEDSDQRGQSVQWKRGGNASNNCTVYSQYGIESEFLGTISSDIAGRFLKEDLISQNIAIDHCVFVEDEECPTSCVLLNSENGSRTIIHCRKNFPELSYQSLLEINLEDYCWFHFEGRNVENTKKMMKYIQDWRLTTNSSAPISVEIEKARPEKLELLAYGDYVFIDKDFARMSGYETMESAVEGLSDKLNSGAVLICAWGAKGACARCINGDIVVSPAFPPPRMVDTLGAGDTFVASTVCALLKGRSVQQAITFGCQIAGAKCGFVGFTGINKVYETVIEKIKM